jgi:hypothetical protein
MYITQSQARQFHVWKCVFVIYFILSDPLEYIMTLLNIAANARIPAL